MTWLATDNLTLGGNFSYTPSEYTEDLFVKDPANICCPATLFPDQQDLVKNINGNQLLQVPEGKATGWASYAFPITGGSRVELFTIYSWIDEVYYSPFESDAEKADDYARLDLRATWTSPEQQWIVSAFINNVFDDVGVLQVLRENEAEMFRHSAGTTTPQLYGLEFTYKLGNY